MNDRKKSAIKAICIGMVGWAIGVSMPKLGNEHEKSLNAEIESLRTRLSNMQLVKAVPSGSASAFSSGKVSEKTAPSAFAGTQSLADRIAQDEALSFDGWVKRTAAANSAEYDKLFADLGISPEIAEHVKSNSIVLHKQAIEAGKPLETLLRTRYQHDKELRAKLSEADYQRYRQYEEQKPATREYDMLRDFAWKVRGVALNPAEADTLIQLIAKAGATTTETWHGPYDPAPRPIVGLESMVARQRDRLNHLKNSSDKLLDAVRQAELAEEVKQLIQEYYNATVQEKEREIRFMDRPEDEVRNDIYRFDAEMLKRLPESRSPVQRKLPHGPPPQLSK